MSFPTVMFTLLFILLLTFASNDFSFYYNLGIEATMAQDYKLAIEQFEKALMYEPTHIEARQLCGSAYITGFNDHINGLEHLQVAYEADKGSSSNIVMNYIEALRLNGRISAALAAGYEYLSRHPADANVLHNTAVVEEDNGNYTGANQLFVECLNADRSHLNCWERSANLLISTGHYVEAESLLERGLEILPTAANLLFIAGLAKHYQNKFIEASAMYARCVELDPSHAIVHVNLGAVYQALGSEY